MSARYVFDSTQSNFTVQAFVAGMLSMTGHSPTFAIRDFGGEFQFTPDTVAPASLTIMVCPSSYDLGEVLRVVLLSVTEGEEKPLKCPNIFNSADVAIVTKTDLSEATEFDRAAALKNIEGVRPGIRIFELSAKTGAGMERWLQFLLHFRADSRSSAK